MEVIKLSDDVLKKLKYIVHDNLTEEQELLIDKIILNEELKERYKKHDLCKECKQPNTGHTNDVTQHKGWCQSCNAKHFQQNFKSWTSGNIDIDEYIQNSQLKAKCCEDVLEWIEYDKLENIEYLAKGEFGTVHKAIWKVGKIYCLDSENSQWVRYRKNYEKGQLVALKCIHNSQDITVEFLREEIESDMLVRCYGITKDPETNNFMIIMEHNTFIKHDVCEECGQLNTGFLWCQSCNAQYFQQNFKYWSSKNHDIDEFIRNSQLKAKCCEEVLEWIEYDKFENVEYLAESNFDKAIWKDGFIYCWNSVNNQWKRYREHYKEGQPVTLKCLNDSQNIIFEFFKEIESYSDSTCYGITKHPETNNFMMVFSIKEIKLSDDVIEKVKDFKHRRLSKEQVLLIDKLILSEELKERYKKHGLCKECKQPNTGLLWCQACNAKHFQLDFKNWTSGNHDIDEYIQNLQVKAKCNEKVLEWIEHDKFGNIEYLAKGGFVTAHKAIWKDRYIQNWDSKNNQWRRYNELYNEGQLVVLKCIHNSQDITVELLREKIESDKIVRCYGITKDPETNSIMIVMEHNTFIKYYIKHGVCEGCGQPNTGFLWCQSCNAQHFQQNFKYWSSKNHDIDEFIQNSQLKAKCYEEVLECIEYDKFENVEYLAESKLGTVYKAIWKDGFIYCWNFENNQWKRFREHYKEGQPVTLRCLRDLQNITLDFLKEIESHSDSTCYGITKHPETNNFMMVFSIEEIKLSDDVIEQVKDFKHRRLSKEQELLIDKLILNEELKERYKKHGLCKECKQPNTGNYWCQSCNAKNFQQNFKNWTSGNHDIDEYILNLQVKTKCNEEILEWIEYDKFENVEYLAKVGCGTAHKAIRKVGNIRYWDSKNNQWTRYRNEEQQLVALKYIHNSQDITVELLREEIESKIVRCYGITKDPETNNFMIVMEHNTFIEYYITHGVCEECEQPNTGFLWCQSCNAQHFQQNFKNWTSANHDIDEFIQNSQRNAKCCEEVLEWIEYDKFENVEYLAESKFGTFYKAIWKDGYIYCWNSESNQWKRYREHYKEGQPVTLKCLHYSQNITFEFIKEIESHIDLTCYGITKHLETNNFMMVFSIKKIKLSDDILKEIKYIDHDSLTEEQELLIDKLILNEELKERYKKYGSCKECKQLNTGFLWCQSCNAKRFQQNFKNWTSGNHDIDEYIQNAQFKAKCYKEVLEWIEYGKFENVEYLAESVYKAIWKDGYIYDWDSENNQWARYSNEEQQLVALKCIHNSQDITVELSREMVSDLVVRCYGITKDPEMNNFMMVIDYEYNLCEECGQPNTDDSWCQSCNAKHFQQNFKNWTSGNYDIDEFIKSAQLKAECCKEVLEWIEYDKFKNVEYLAKGGFGITYKANWNEGYIESWDSKNIHWKRHGEGQVALKCLNNSQDITVEFLKEVGSHLVMNSTNAVVTCYGIAKYPITNNFMMVMEYAENGSLRHHLDNNFISLNWDDKLKTLSEIAKKLENIHNNGLIHHDFHCGNILSFDKVSTYITDLGLCQPANVRPSQSDDKQIFGVLPYVAPEVLRGKEYTQASDIYGFGIIAFELCTGLPPYYNIDHGSGLAISICNGLRPESNFKIPRLILDIIKQCWDANPSKRPKAEELQMKIMNLYINSNEDENYNKQIEEADKINKQIPFSISSSSSTNILSYTTHPQAIYASRLLDFKNLPEPKNTDDINNSFKSEYSESTRVDFAIFSINSKEEGKKKLQETVEKKKKIPLNNLGKGFDIGKYIEELIKNTKDSQPSNPDPSNKKNPTNTSKKTPVVPPFTPPNPDDNQTPTKQN